MSIITANRRREKYVYAALLLSGLAIFLSACTVRSTTSYIKGPVPAEDSKKVKNIPVSCLHVDRILTGFDKHEILGPAFSSDEGKKAKVKNEIRRMIEKEELQCKDSPPRKDYWKLLRVQLIKDHDGLLDENVSELAALDNLKLATVGGAEISASFLKPGSLSLSTRVLPSEQEPGGAFAGMKERAQAALIDFAREFARFKDKKDIPEKEARALLDTLSITDEPRFAETRKIEFTVSSILNSASVNDRFDYITSYLSIPPLPGRLNGGVSLSQIFLDRFCAKTMARVENDRMDFVPADIWSALHDLKVWIEIVDPLKTEVAPIKLGTLKSEASGDITVGQVAGGSLQVTGTTGKLSASREDKIAMELDRRSFFIGPDRTLLRITQRGIQEATISGSFPSAIALRIPKTNLHIITMTMDADKKKVSSVQTKNVEQPLYKEIYGIADVLGTVRIAKPSVYPYRKEDDGVAYTIAEDPVLLMLWSYKRSLWSLDLRDLIPETAFEENKLHMGLHQFAIRTLSGIRQGALFKDYGSWADFIEALKQNKLFLIENNTDPEGSWYVISACNCPSERDLEKEFAETLAKKGNKRSRKNLFAKLQKEKYKKLRCEIEQKRNDKKPDLHDIWLGFEDNDGQIKPLKIKLPSMFTQCNCLKAESEVCKFD